MERSINEDDIRELLSNHNFSSNDIDKLLVFIREEIEEAIFFYKYCEERR